MELVGKVSFDTLMLEDDDMLFVDKGDFKTLKDGFSAYLFADKFLPEELRIKLNNKNINYITEVDKNRISTGDVVEINTERNSMKVLYKNGSFESIILVTNQCNNNCIMCPDPDSIRQTRNNQDINKLKTLIKLMDSRCNFICITGGEPTLLKKDLFILLNECRNKFNNAEFLMLTNGRAFYYENYTKEFINHSPTNIILGIPIHSYKEEVHDSITRAAGSFKETCIGINNLLKYKQLVEIRIVINKYNYKDLTKIAKKIVENYKDCYRVNFMAMEILGNALVNLEDVWVDFQEFKYELEKACMILLSNGIRAYIYNMPLCYVDKKLWPITKKSITNYKVRFGEECDGCREREKCGGFFFSTKRFKNLKGQRIL